MSNYKAALDRIDRAQTVEDLRRVSTGLTRVYDIGQLTDGEFLRLDLKLCDKINLSKLGAFASRLSSNREGDTMSIKKQYTFDNFPMLSAMSALINGDMSGLETTDETLLDQFLEQFSDVATWDYETLSLSNTRRL